MLNKKDLIFLKKYIADRYLDEDNLHRLKENFYSQKYVKHLALPDFFKDDFIEWIKNDIRVGKRDHEEFYTNQEWYKKWTWSYISGKYLADLYRFFHSASFYRYMEYFYNTAVSTPISLWFRLENIMRSLLGSRWSLIQIYNSGDYLAWHTDGPVNTVAGSYVFFLNEDWNESQWWALELWYKNNLRDINAITYKSIAPVMNTFVFFKCERDISWHRVQWVSSWERKTYHDQLLYK